MNETVTGTMMLIPCKIGDELWCVRNYQGKYRAKSGVVSLLYFTDEMELAAVVKDTGRGVIGKGVFLTEEEAWKEAERREKREKYFEWNGI